MAEITLLTENQAREIAEHAAKRAVEMILEKLSVKEAVPTSDVMTVKQAAEYLKCSTSHLRNKIRRKEIPSYNRLGRPRLYRVDLDQWLKQIT
jgi:excisionase family DNA binding protein